MAKTKVPENWRIQTASLS